MKATGIVRRIDDLGRVVIPKEIRRTMRIREGDPLEIYTNSGGEVIFKKYSPMGELASFAAEYADALASSTSLSVLICDRDHCIAAAGVSKKEVLERPISTELEDIIESRRSKICTIGEEIYAVQGVERKVCVAVPIISAGDVTGAVVLCANESARAAEDADIKLATVAAKFLSNQTE